MQTEPTIFDGDEVMGRLLVQSEEVFLRDVQKDFSYWEKQAPYIENYLNQQMAEIVSHVVVNIDDVSPLYRFQLLTTLSKADNSAQKIGAVEKLSTYQNDNQLSWKDLQERSGFILKGLQRSFMIIHKQRADRIAEEYKIIKGHLNLSDNNSIAAHLKLAVSTYEPVRIIIAAIDFARLCSDRFSDQELAQKYLPPLDVVTDAMDAGLQYLKLEKVFIPVVLNTIESAENPYLLLTYLEDLVILFAALTGKGGSKSESININHLVAAEERKRDLISRTATWNRLYLFEKIKDKEQNTAFAKALKDGISQGFLGTGRVLAALKSKVSTADAKKRYRIYFGVSLVLSDELPVMICSQSVSFWSNLIFNLNKDGQADINLVLERARESRVGLEGITDKDKKSLQEIISIIDLLNSLVPKRTR